MTEGPLGSDWNSAFGGTIACDDTAFIRAAELLYTDESAFTTSQRRGFALLRSLFDKATHSATLAAMLT